MSAAATSSFPTTTTTSSSTTSIHRRQLPAPPIHTQQLPIPPHRQDYSPLSSGLPSPNFPSPKPLPNVLLPQPTTSAILHPQQRGRSPAPPSLPNSRHPSRQQSIRRLSSISAHPSRNPSFSALTATRRPSYAFDHHDFSAIAEDILSEGDVIGPGESLHGESIQEVQILTSAHRADLPPANRLQVVRKLGAGSYAVVYLVREILATELLDPPKPPAGDDILSHLSSDDDDLPNRYRHSYGREFAVKCLSKVTLTPEELDIQLFEAKLHQSLPTHPNIITLYRTLQTPSYLLLILEFVPGEDLFYFLEQSRDAHPSSDADYLVGAPRPLPPVPGSSSSNALMMSNTPPTPSLLSTSHPQALLSYQRLRLIVSMFSQMCDAVDACHAQGVSHRDIKPENFIVTEGTRANGMERKVVVKLSDFGLATLLKDSTDVDCGSAPYMSYECRNNVAPTYATQPADVWSLGIVLINMLYHHNPWSDTATLATVGGSNPTANGLPLATPLGSNPHAAYTCPSFAAFIASPVQFFLQRFPGMTYPVADYLANRVFCILPQPSGVSPKITNVGTRVTARDFGQWVKSLPNLMGDGAGVGMGMGMRMPIGGSKLALEVEYDHPAVDDEVPAMLPQTVEVDDAEGQDGLRSPSSTKRRGKRGARRKDKSQPPSTTSGNPSFSSLLDTTGPPTAAEVEQLASEISRSTAPLLRSSASKTSVTSGKSRMSATERALARMPPMPSAPPPAPPSRASVDDIKTLGRSLNEQEKEEKKQQQKVPVVEKSESLNAPPPPPPAEQPPTVKKSWIDRLKFSNNSSSSSSSPPAHAAPRAHESPMTMAAGASRTSLATTASGSSTTSSNVRSIMSGLESTRPPQPAAPTAMVRAPHNPQRRPYEPVSMFSGLQWASPVEEMNARRPPPTRVVNDLDVQRPVPAGGGGKKPSLQWSSVEENLPPAPARRPPVPPPSNTTTTMAKRAMDRSWRASIASAATTESSSASSLYTRFDNASVRSVSTVATSVSAGSGWRGSDSASWRSGSVGGEDAPPRPRKGGGAGSGVLPPPQTMRTNVKRMDGVPRELDDAPRYLQPRVKGVLQPPAPPVNKHHHHHPHPNLAIYSHQTLGSIDERHSPPPTSPADAAVSTTDLESVVAEERVAAVAPVKATTGFRNVFSFKTSNRRE